MQIQILNVTPSQQPSKTGNGKTFSQLEVAFKNLTFGGKVEGKKLMGFLDQKPAYDVLINALPNEIYEVEIMKKDGFNNWVSAKKSDGTINKQEAHVVPSARPAGGYSTATTASPKSTYETPEERAKKQIYIVRQSSISNAIDLLSVGAKTAPKVEDVVSTAKQFEAFVFGDSNAPIVVDKGVDGFKDLDTMDDVPH